jgi:hypothetical protein
MVSCILSSMACWLSWDGRPTSHDDDDDINYDIVYQKKMVGTVDKKADHFWNAKNCIVP